MFCVECDAAATVYCEADTAFLCAPCDVKVHSANRLALRHVRVQLHEIDDAVDALLVPDLQTKFPASQEVCQWDAIVPDAADLASAADACVKREAEELAASSGAFLHLFSKRFASPESSSVSDVTVRADSELNAISDNNSNHTPERTEEERRRDRVAALQRFRNKRANRSFAKKVRYECRKQLADRRPRVKGRFVKKCEMALYLKYGANYRLYLHEIAESVEVKPSLSGKVDRTKTEIDEFLSKSSGTVQAPFSSPSSIMTEP